MTLRPIASVIALAWCAVGCGGSSDEQGDAPPTETDPVRCLTTAPGFFTYFTTGSQYSDGATVSSLTYSYPSSAISLSFGESLRVSGTVADYSAFGVLFQACVNASTSSGIELDLGGNVGPTPQLTVYASTRKNSPEPPFTMIGTCVPSDASQPYLTCHDAYAALPVSSSVAHVTIPFASFLGGEPNPGADPSELLAIFFSFDWNQNQAPYSVDLTVGDLAFSR